MSDVPRVNPGQIVNDLKMINAAMPQLLSILKVAGERKDEGRCSEGCLMVMADHQARTLRTGWAYLDEIPDDAARDLTQGCHAGNPQKMLVVVFHDDRTKHAYKISPLVAHWSRSEMQDVPSHGFALLEDRWLPPDEGKPPETLPAPETGDRFALI